MCLGESKTIQRKSWNPKILSHGQEGEELLTDPPLSPNKESTSSRSHTIGLKDIETKLSKMRQAKVYN